MENNQDCFTFIPNMAGTSAMIYLCLFLPFNVMQMGTNADVGDVMITKILCCLSAV